MSGRRRVRRAVWSRRPSMDWRGWPKRVCESSSARENCVGVPANVEAGGEKRMPSKPPRPLIHLHQDFRYMGDTLFKFQLSGCVWCRIVLPPPNILATAQQPKRSPQKREAQRENVPIMPLTKILPCQRTPERGLGSVICVGPCFRRLPSIAPSPLVCASLVSHQGVSIRYYMAFVSIFGSPAYIYIMSWCRRCMYQNVCRGGGCTWVQGAEVIPFDFQEAPVLPRSK